MELPGQHNYRKKEAKPKMEDNNVNCKPITCLPTTARTWLSNINKLSNCYGD